MGFWGGPTRGWELVEFKFAVEEKGGNITVGKDGAYE